MCNSHVIWKQDGPTTCGMSRLTVYVNISRNSCAKMFVFHAGLKFKGTSTDIYKTVFRKALFMWSSMLNFSFIRYTLTLSYLENLTIDDNFINKRVRPFIHQTKDVWSNEEKIISTSLKTYFFKKIQKQPPEVFCKKNCS